MLNMTLMNPQPPHSGPDIREFPMSYSYKIGSLENIGGQQMFRLNETVTRPIAVAARINGFWYWVMRKEYSK